MASENSGDRVDALSEWLTAEMKGLDRHHQTELGQIVMSVAATYVNKVPKKTENRVMDARAKKGYIRPRTAKRFTRYKTHLGFTPSKNRRTLIGHTVPGGERPAGALVPEFFPVSSLIREYEIGTAATVGAALTAGALRNSVDAALEKVATWRRPKAKSGTSAGKGAPGDDPADILSHDQALEMLYERASEPTDAETSGDEMLNGQEMARYLGTSRQTINARYKKGTIIGLGREVGGPVYPKTQFAENRSPGGPVWLDGLDAVVAEHGNGWRAWIWLNNRKDELGGDTPLERLQAGDVSAVKAALGREREGAFS
ncbi:hypothetical protein J7355_15650 [Endozoicomonas sp. G2_2]|uniref:hypothetical protein n=1 Tax=Endozoicomonas sp. G2_2 TaxID=2821092 RepID=UPI001ADD3E8E|nr:hypothetical protein [Endozoicomonas sp. G2_2]MBO9471524.1 hypothetical protein [Endozoicomonas sp. G2_2]